MRKRMVLLAVLMTVTMLMGAFGLATQAYAYDQSQVGSTNMFSPGGFKVSFMNARLKSYSFTQNRAQNLKVYEGRYLWEDVYASKPMAFPDSVSFRIPVPAHTSFSLADGQEALDGVSFSVVLSNLGTYKGESVQAKISVSDFKDCLPSLRRNGNPGAFIESDSITQAIYGDADGEGYFFCFTAHDLVNHEAMLFSGTESEKVTIEYQYEDGSPIQLDSADRLLVSISSLDRDGLGDNKGAEGVQLLDAICGWTSTDTLVARGSISPTLYGLGLNGSYLDSDATPTYYGTTANQGASQWLDKSVTYLADTSDGRAETSFRVIDQVGFIGFPLNATPLTAFVPEAPEKAVDKTEASVGDEVTYTVSQKINQSGDDALQSYSYSSWAFEDMLDDALAYRSLRVLDGNGKDVTDQGTVGSNGQKVTFSFSSEYLKAMKLDGSTYSYVLVARVVSAAGGQEIPNKATVTFNNEYSQDTNTVVTKVPAKGGVVLRKSSALPDTSDGNACYSLAGATYGIYSDEGCTQLVTTLETDSSGQASATGLEVGKRYIREVAASKGYALDPSTYEVEVKADATASVNGEQGVAEMPQSDELSLVLQKADAETGGAPVQEGLSLAGARYELTYYPGPYDGAREAQASGKGLRSWVLVTDESGRLMLSDERKVSGDAFYANSEGKPALPVGSYVFREIEAPAGYQLSEELLFARVTSTGETEQVDTYAVPTASERPIGGQVVLTKTSDPAPGTKVAPGQKIAYTLTLVNGSDVPVENVAVFDEIPEHALYVDGSVSTDDSGAYLEDRNAVAWVIPSLEPGEKRSTTFAVTVSEDVGEGCSIVNMASWGADHPALPDGPLAEASNKVEHVVTIGDGPDTAPREGDGALTGSEGSGTARGTGGSSRMPQTGQTVVALLLLALGAVLFAWGWRRHRQDTDRPPVPRIY